MDDTMMATWLCTSKSRDEDSWAGGCGQFFYHLYLVSLVLETFWDRICVASSDAVCHAFAHVIINVVPRLLTVWFVA